MMTCIMPADGCGLVAVMKHETKTTGMKSMNRSHRTRDFDMVILMSSAPLLYCSTLASLKTKD